MTLEAHLQAFAKKYLIFDFDETLIHLHLPWDIFIDKQLDILKKFDPELVEKNAKDTHIMSLVNMVVKKHGQPVRQASLVWAEEFESTYLTGYSQNLELLDFVRQYQHDYTFFVWSSNCLSTIQPILKELGLSEIFKKVISKNDVQLVKPEPDGFNSIQAWLQTEQDVTAKLSEFLMIGDSTADQGAAKNAGINFFKVKYF